MSPVPMHVLIVTDAFPPISGGSGWSTYELARGLRARGDGVTIVRPRPGTPRGLRTVTDAYDGFTVHEVGSPSVPVPFVRNYLKNERLTVRLVPILREIIRRERVDVVHGQHLLSTPAAVAAARAERVPGLATIRDYWPVCYWSDLIHDRRASSLCPGCSAGMMTRCLRPHTGAAWPLALPAIPYMRANLAWKRQSLAGADAVIAVSGQMAADLVARAPELDPTRVHVIPNPVDLAALERLAGTPTAPPVEGPYAIYVGKLAPNKGSAHLVPAIVRAGLRWPLVVVGDGPDRAAVEAAATAARLTVHFTGWLHRPAAIGWLARASLLVFPSHGPESLSRVLLESAALGIPVAAMDTGGTRDIVVAGETGLLSTSMEGLASDIARLAGDDGLRRRLGDAARVRVRREFDAPGVVDRVAGLYATLRERRASGAVRA